QSPEIAAGNSDALFPAGVLLMLSIVQLPGQLALVRSSMAMPLEQIEVRAKLPSLRTAEDEFILADRNYLFDVVQAGHRPLLLDNLTYALMYDNGLIDTRP